MYIFYYYLVARICFFSLARLLGRVEETDIDILSRLDFLLRNANDAFDEVRDNSERDRSIVDE